MKLLITTQAVDVNHPILGFFIAWILEFAKHFDEVHIICLQKGEYELPPHVHVYSLGKEAGENKLKYLYRFYTYFAHIFFKARVDYVFFHMGAIYNILAAPFFFLRKSYGTKFYWWKTHGVINAKAKLALAFVDAVYTAGSMSFTVKTKKVHVVGHAIDTDRFTLTHHSPIPGRVLAVGRITPIKELETTLRVIAALVSSGRHFELRLIGTNDDGIYKEKLDTLITELAIDAFVTFVGSMNQEELQHEYEKAELLIHPAYRAGFDKVVLEAMASGVIPLTSTPSFEPLLEPFDLFVNAGDVGGYVSRILMLGDGNAKKLLPSKLRQIVIDGHSVETLSQRIFGI